METFDSPEEETKQITINGEAIITVKNKQQIPPWKFVFVIYFCVCGGAYGFESAIQTGYPAYTLCFLFTVPFVWALPIALVTSELGSALPSNEGAFLWIRTAFGPNVSFIASFLYWINYSFDTALYPSLFYSYFMHFDEELFSQTGFLIGIPLMATLFVVTLNIIGIDIIGTLSMILLFIQLTPLFLLFFFALANNKINPHDWITLPPGDQLSLTNLQNLSSCLQVMIWSYSGYDSIGCIVEELQNSRKNLRKCLFGASALASSTYFIVIIGSVGLEKDYTKWDEGYLSTMGENLVGPWLKYFIIIAAMIATLGTFNALMLPTSQQLKSLGGPNYLNLSFLSYVHPKFNTPIVAIIINGIICGLCGSLNFLFLVKLNNIFYGILIILICLSAIRLRFSEPGRNIRRPFKIAEENSMVVLAVLWPIFICVYLIVDAWMSDWKLAVISLSIIVLLFILWGGIFYWKKIKTEKEVQKEEEYDKIPRTDTIEDSSEEESKTLLTKLVDDDDY